VNDITINTIKVKVEGASTTVSYDTLVSSAQLILDGKTISAVSSDISGNTTNVATIKFDAKGDTVIKAGNRVKAELRLKFKSLAAVNEGLTIRGKVDSANSTIIDAEGADTLGNSQLSGSATGDWHTLRTKGISSEKGTRSAVLTSGVSGGHDTVKFTIPVVVTAFNQDVYISKTAATSLVYDLTDSSGTLLSSTASTAVDSFSSDADDTTAPGYFYIPEGSSKTVTLVVKWSPTGAATAKGVQLKAINYAETAVSPTATWNATPVADYRTDAVSTNL